MPSGRFGLSVLSLVLSGAVLPASAQSAAPAAQKQPAAPSPGSDVIVNGSTDQKSDWKRAESDHVVVTSKGSEAEIKRVSTDLEQLYRLMARVYHRADTPDDTLKLQVVLVDSADFVRTMQLRNLRSDEGPYPKSFANERYYDPRADGALLVVARTDQVIDLDTSLQADQDFEDAAGAGDVGSSVAMPSDHPPIARSWEAVLYSAFAQHFMATYLPAAYPRWYMDGVGALFSTMLVRKDGKIDYARPPAQYPLVFHAYGPLNVGAILTGQYLQGGKRRPAWTPYHAWLLAHFLLFSNTKPERRVQFQQYMTAIHQGTPMADAAKVFGDMRRLQQEVNGYLEHPTSFARTEQAPKAIAEPLVTTLSRANAALIDERIELDSRLAVTPAGADETRRRTEWLAQVRREAAQLPDTTDAILVAAETECRSGHDAECLADAGRVLARSPDNVTALAWKGIAQTHEAVTGPAANRPAALDAARLILERANRIDSDAPLPLIGYFRSFTDAGERVPEDGVRGMAKVVRRVPAAPGPRLYLAEELVRQGQGDLARRVIYPVLYGPYDSPEKAAAVALFAPAAGTGVSGSAPAGAIGVSR